MASYYVYFLAVGAGTGADWANAFTTLAAALTGRAAGDIFYVADDHAETQASAMTCTSPGTIGNPCLIYCVLRSGGSVPPVSADLRTTATVTTTGANALTTAGSAYCYGITFSAGSGVTNAILTIANTNGAEWVMVNCGLKKLGLTGISTAITLGNNNGGKVTLINTTVEFGVITDSMFVLTAVAFIWRGNTSAVVGVITPTTLFSGTGVLHFIEGVDLSALGVGKTIVIAASQGNTYLKDCKLNALATVAAAQTNPKSGVYVSRSDSGATNYNDQLYNYRGTLTTETSIVRTGGASDGATPVSKKIVTTANSKWAMPFEAPPIAIWNATIAGNVTVTLQGTWNSASLPNNDDIWEHIEYLGSATSPLGSVATSGKADGLATGTPLAASGSAWGGGGSGAGWSPFTVTKTFTAPVQPGWIYVYVRAAKASSTFYVDPLIVVT